MAEIPDNCPRCGVPLRLSQSGRIPGVGDEILASGPLFYCPKCKSAWRAK